MELIVEEQEHIEKGERSIKKSFRTKKEECWEVRGRWQGRGGEKGNAIETIHVWKTETLRTAFSTMTQRFELLGSSQFPPSFWRVGGRRISLPVCRFREYSIHTKEQIRQQKRSKVLFCVILEVETTSHFLENLNAFKNAKNKETN